MNMCIRVVITTTLLVFATTGCSSEDDETGSTCTSATSGPRLNEIVGRTGAIELITDDPSISLTGWSLRAQLQTKTLEYTFAGQTLEPGAFLVVPEQTHALSIFAANTLALLDPSGRVVDCISWPSGTHWESLCREPLLGGWSIECIETLGAENATQFDSPNPTDGSDSDEATDDVVDGDTLDEEVGGQDIDEPDPDTGGDDTTTGVDIGPPPTVYNVVINEVADETDRVELLNLEADTVDLSGYTLSTVVTDTTIVLDDLTLPPGVPVTLNLVALNLDLELADTLTLAAGDTTVDSVSWCAGASRPSWGRVPDGTGDFAACVPTFSAPNEATTGPALPLPVWEVPNGDGPELSAPPTRLSVTIDTDGQTWVGDRDANRLLVYDESGAFLFVVDGANPVALAATPGGGVAMLDDDGRVGLYSTDGQLTAVLNAAVDEGLLVPNGLSYDPDGRLFVTDIGSVQVLEVDVPSDAVVRVYAPGVGQGVLNDLGPSALISSLGRLLVADVSAGVVVSFSWATGDYLPDDTITGALLTVQGNAVDGFVADRIGGLAAVPGVLFVADWDGSRVLYFDTGAGTIFSPADTWGYLGAIGRQGDGCLDLDGVPAIAASADADRLVVVDAFNRRVRAYSLSTILQ